MKVFIYGCLQLSYTEILHAFTMMLMMNDGGEPNLISIWNDTLKESAQY